MDLAKWFIGIKDGMQDQVELGSLSGTDITGFRRNFSWMVEMNIVGTASACDSIGDATHIPGDILIFLRDILAQDNIVAGSFQVGRDTMQAFIALKYGLFHACRDLVGLLQVHIRLNLQIKVGFEFTANFAN